VRERLKVVFRAKIIERISKIIDNKGVVFDIFGGEGMGVRTRWHGKICAR
jgi:hypothetical protein